MKKNKMIVVVITATIVVASLVDLFFFLPFQFSQWINIGKNAKKIKNDLITLERDVQNKEKFITQMLNYSMSKRLVIKASKMRLLCFILQEIQRILLPLQMEPV